ncbi:retropepsin-like aspartic protease [Acidicapsa ligni]|uniref:retropepsin-like aspartic protease n=1 Tax=Acidicapsa ligni TaxID=542300 RepID=UPI0021DF840D|nr:retropepsin-like aspartic protease [Acidicapsa ligni]
MSYIIRGLEISRVLSVGIAILAGFGSVAWAANCSVVKEHEPSAAEQALSKGDNDKAVLLYRSELGSHKNDAELTAGLVEALLRQEKMQDASDAVEAALKGNHEGAHASAVLLTAKAEVQYREGIPWDAATTATAAFQADPCLPRAHLILGRIARLNSYYATAKSNMVLAHRLDPGDVDIQREWLATLPRKQRVVELQQPASESDKSTQLAVGQSNTAKAGGDASHGVCRLVSSTQSTEIPLGKLMQDAMHVRAYGLDVRLNDKVARLEIDTGAPGLTVSKHIADQAGLKPVGAGGVIGVGDQGNAVSYTAYADSIKIGDMAFQDCMVKVIEDKRLSQDGLIGLDVFSNFLLTLNYPDHKLALGPLPPRPSEGAVQPTLGTDGAEADSSAEQAGPFDRYIAPEMKDYTQIYRVGHDLLLPVSLNKSKWTLMIMDSGAFATTISPATARSVTNVHVSSDYEIKGINGKVDKVYAAREIRFVFAKKAELLEEVPAFDTSNISRNLGVEVAGFLGARTLTQMSIHIDYRDGLVRMDYNPNKLKGDQEQIE